VTEGGGTDLSVAIHSAGGPCSQQARSLVLFPGRGRDRPVKAPDPESVKSVELGLARARLDLRRGQQHGAVTKLTGKLALVAVIAVTGGRRRYHFRRVWRARFYRWKVVSIRTAGVSLVKLDVHGGRVGKVMNRG